jgi:hypothetical protein
MQKATSPKSPKLSPTEAKYIKAKVEGKSNTQAALIATRATSVNSAKTLGHRLSTKVNVQEALQIALDKHGLTADRIIGVVADGMDATKTVIIGKDEDAFADQVPDHGVRLKAAGMAAQFRGYGKTTVEGGIHFHQHTEKKQDDYDF